MEQYSEDELSQWLGPEEKPNIIGVWMTQPAMGYFSLAFQYWDGVDFGLRAITPRGAVLNGASGISSPHQRVWWRGLKVNPEVIE